MGDIQFKAFVRFLLDALLEAREEEDPEKRKVKMAKIMSNLQKVLAE